ncbi:MAG TPA: hypothetical protein VLX90_18340 [Steroidobacteraceae bacterium]|nr:hypothetical protein [Steroidobacteraceae bacterium]
MPGLVALLLLSVGALADPDSSVGALKTPQDARALADSVMGLVLANKIDAAFAKLKPYWPVPGAEIDSLALKSISARDSAAARYGPTIGWVFIREEKVSDFLIRDTYVEKREHHALRWLFYFYKPNSSWLVNSVTWDDNIQDLFL